MNENGLTKVLMSSILVIGLLLNSITPAFAQDSVKVTINGEYVKFDQPPVIIDGRTLVPIRAVCEGLGADVYWDKSEPSGVAIVKNRVKMIFTIDSNEFVGIIADSFSEFVENDGLGFNLIDLEVPAQIINDRMVVPIRVVCEALGAKVDWDADNRTIVITCPEETINDKNRDTTFFDEFATHMSDAEQNRDEKMKDRFRDFPYIATITISGFSDFKEYVTTREIIEARTDWIQNQKDDWEQHGRRPHHTLDLSQEGKIVVIFGYEEDFDIDGFAKKVTKTSELYFTDAEGNVIVDKSNIITAKSVWQGQTKDYSVEIKLTEEGRQKFSVGTEAISKLADNYICVYFDGSIISTPRVMGKVDSNSFVITGFVNSAAAESLVMLITTKSSPENLKVEVDIEPQK